MRLRDLKLTGYSWSICSHRYQIMYDKIKKTAEEVESQFLDELSGTGIIDETLLAYSGSKSFHFRIAYWGTMVMVFVSGIILHIISMQIFLTFWCSTTNKPNDPDLKVKHQRRYSYFQCGWLGPISYHQIMLSSLYCLLNADCRADGINMP